MTRYQRIFLEKLVKLSEEYGFVITEEGYIEPIRDWIEPNRSFEYMTEESSDGIKITGVEMKL